MYNFKINEIETNDGSIIVPKKINIIVGANNSGKSRFLKDIRDILGSRNNGPVEPDRKEKIVVKNIRCELPSSKEEFFERYKILERCNKSYDSYVLLDYNGVKRNLSIDNNVNNVLDNSCIQLYNNWEEELTSIIDSVNKYKTLEEQIIEENTPPGATNSHIIDTKTLIYTLNGVEHSIVLEEGSVESSIISNNQKEKNFIDMIGNLFFCYLGNEEKLLLCKKQICYGLDSSSFNFLSKINSMEVNLRSFESNVKKLFNKDVFLDSYSYTGKIVIRVGDDFDFIRKAKRSDKTVERKLKDYALLDDEGDGIKSFISTYLSMNDKDKNIILLDEPESFLHPPIARKLGELIPQEISDDQQIFVVTHSEDILNGIVSNSKMNDFNIIRIEREDDINKISVLNDDNKKMIKKKAILKASNILKGLFANIVFITESYTDTIIYQKLVSNVVDPSLLYCVNTQTKSVIYNIVSVFDNLNIKNYAIYDFDFFRNSQTLTDIIKVKNIPLSIQKTLRNARGKLVNEVKKMAKEEYDKMDKTDVTKTEKELIKEFSDKYYYQSGIYSLNNELQKELEQAIEILESYGIIVLKSGCLESILIKNGLDFDSDKVRWYDAAFDYIDRMSKDDVCDIDIVKRITKLLS